MRIQQVDIPTGEDGHELAASASGPDESLSVETHSILVVMVHDIPFGHTGAQDDFFEFLRGVFDEHGLHTLLFDFQGCGTSEGKHKELDLDRARANLKDVMAWARHEGFKEFVIVACGAAAALAIEETAADTKMILLFWPAVDLAAHGKRLYAPDAHIMAEDMARYNLERITRSIRTPVLVQYGTQDERFDPGQIDTLKDRLNALRIDITSYDDGNHGLTDPRHRRMVAHHIGQFLHKYA